MDLGNWLVTDILSLNYYHHHSPRSILDVGANVGNWTTDLSHLFKESNFFMIEGNDKHIDKLKTIGFPFEISLVGDKIRNISYYKATDNGGNIKSSLFLSFIHNKDIVH